MAKKIASTPPTPSTGPTPPTRRRTARTWFAFAAILVIAALAVGAWFVHGERVQRRVQAALPAPPDVAGKPRAQVDAIRQAGTLTRTRGRTLEGVAELGRLYHANGYVASAEACWRLLAAEQSQEARWPYYLADLRRMAGDPAELAALLQKVVALAPDYAPAWLQLADVEFKTGNLAAADAHYRRRLSLVPGDAYARLGLARVAQAQGRVGETRKQLEQLVADVPTFSSGHNVLAELLAAAGDEDGARHHRWLGREAGRFREAQDPWRDELEAWCHDFNELCLRASVAFETGQGDRGQRLLEKAIALDPTHPTGYEMLGSLHRKRGELAKARDTFETGLQAAVSHRANASYYVSLSETYGELRQAAEALRITELGLAQTSDTLELHTARGVALAELGRHGDAEKAFRHVLNRLPDDSNANYQLGLTMLALSRTEDAHAAFKRSLRQQPTFLKSLSLLGRWELQAGRLQAASDYLLPLYDSHPGVPAVRELLAQWHRASGAQAEKQNDPAGAERHYRAGVKLDPRHADLQASLGVLLLTQDRVHEAQPPLEAYHALAGDNPQSALFLGQVYFRLGRVDDARRILRSGEELARRTGKSTTAEHFREILRSL